MASPSDNTRPFWLHQIVEYIIGGSLIATGLQSPTPTVPAVVGGLMVLNAAITRGAASAFRIIGLRTHRAVDAVIIAIGLVGVAQPWVESDSGTRVMVLGFVAVFALVWWRTDFTPKARRRGSSADRSSGSGSAGSASSSAAGGPPSTGDQWGRRAGRLAGQTVATAKRMKADRDQRSAD